MLCGSWSASEGGRAVGGTALPHPAHHADDHIMDGNHAEPSGDAHQGDEELHQPECPDHPGRGRGANHGTDHELGRHLRLRSLPDGRRPNCGIARGPKPGPRPGLAERSRPGDRALRAVSPQVRRQPSAAIHPALARAFASLDRESVRWCVLRLPESFRLPRGDIDLLVDRADLQKTAAILRDEDYVRLPRFNESHSFVHYDSVDDAWLWLDVTTELAFGTPPVSTGAEAECLARRLRRPDGVWVLDPVDAFWVLVLRAVLDDRPLSHRHRTQLLAVAADAREGSGHLAQLGARILSTSPQRLVDSILDEDWGSVDRILADTRRAAGGRSLARAGATLSAAVRRLAWRMPSRRRGASVALIGPDGVGKSTLAAGLAQSFFIPTKLVYMGVWRTPRLVAALGAPGRVGHAVLLQWIRWGYGAVHRLRGRLVVFDRYTEEHLAPPRRTDRLGRVLQRLRVLLACPPPDLVLLLDMPGAAAFARKGEHSSEEIERLRARYARAAAQFPRFVVLDAQEPADVVRRRATEAIWRAFGRRGSG
jgi:thymidylate kinase